VVGLLFLTVVSVLVQFAILGVITAILAVGIVVFDSWINRPKGFRAARRAGQERPTGAGRNTGWRANSAISRVRPPAQNFRRPTTVGEPRRQPPPPTRQVNGQPPRQPQRQQPPGQQRQQPPRQPPPLGQPPQGPGQPPQGQPPRPPFRPSPPDPGRARR
jgi:hypothetical protein